MAVAQGDSARSAMTAVGATDGDVEAQAAEPLLSRTVTSSLLYHSQGEMQITKRGRLKLKHDESALKADWKCERLSPYCRMEEPLRFTAEPTVGFTEEFLVDLQHDGGEPMIVLEEGSLAIQSIHEQLAHRCPARVGDRVVKVNSHEVSSVEEYRKLIEAAFALERKKEKGCQVVTLTLRPDDASQSKQASGIGIRKTGHVVDGRPCAESKMERTVTAEAGGRRNNEACIEFLASEVAQVEDKKFAKVSARRIGNTSERVAWPWKAKNVNVAERCWAAFEPQYLSGEVVFEAGETVKSFWVKLSADEAWTTEHMYCVRLLPEEQSSAYRNQNGLTVVLGDNCTCNVYSLNTDSFPAMAYGRLLDFEEEEEKVPEYILAWKFCKHNYREFPWETVCSIFLALIPPLLFYFSQTTFAFLVNCALANSDTAQCQFFSIDMTPLIMHDQYDSALLALLWVAAFRTVVILAKWIIHLCHRELKLGGKACLKLRGSMFYAMLQMSDAATADFDNGDIQQIMDAQVATAVQHVWLSAFVLIRLCGSLMVKIVFTAQLTQRLQGNTLVQSALLACLPFMFLTVTVIFCVRRKNLFKLHKEAFTDEENMGAFVAMTVTANAAIRAYRRDFWFMKQYDVRHKEYNGVAFRALCHSANTLWALRCVFFVVIVGVLIGAGRFVRRDDNELRTGDFLVLLRSIEGFGTDILECTQLLSNMLLGGAAIAKIAKVLNTESWRMEWKHRDLESEVAEQGNELSGNDIVLERVQYSYPEAQVGTKHAVAPLDLALPTGSLICFPVDGLANSCGEHALGLHTLFSIISGRLLPRAGEVKVPARWRVILVPVVPVLFDGTLMFNLMFSDRAQSRDRAWEICKDLGMTPGLLYKEDFDVGPEGRHLKFSDRVIVSIARALMHDVDVLLLPSALDVLGEALALKVIRVLRDYTASRGYIPAWQTASGLRGPPRGWRHRKTVLYTSKFRVLQEQAKYQVERMPKNIVTEKC